MAEKKPPIMTGKADYVRNAPDPTGDHHCHWPGCTAKVKPAVWGCRKHWYTLPQALRNKIWAAFRPGQEISKAPSQRYVEASREAQAWIKDYEASKAAERLL